MEVYWRPAVTAHLLSLESVGAVKLPDDDLTLLERGSVCGMRGTAADSQRQ